MADTPQTPHAPAKDGPYAMYVIIAALAAMTAITVTAIFHFASATDIVTALGPVTGIIGTLAGAYFGMRGSSVAQQHAVAAEQARAAAAHPAPRA
jgi:hypothetical protein